MSKNTKKSMALGTATLVVQFVRATSGEELITAFEHAIDRTSVLRRLQSAVIRDTDTITELRCEVTFGPDRGSEGDLQRHLRRQLGIVAASIGAQEYEVFHFVYTPLTAEGLSATIADLIARADDITLSLSLRKQLAKAVARYVRIKPTPRELGRSVISDDVRLTYLDPEILN